MGPQGGGKYFSSTPPAVDAPRHPEPQCPPVAACARAPFQYIELSHPGNLKCPSFWNWYFSDCSNCRCWPLLRGAPPRAASQLLRWDATGEPVVFTVALIARRGGRGRLEQQEFYFLAVAKNAFFYQTPALEKQNRSFCWPLLRGAPPRAAGERRRSGQLMPGNPRPGQGGVASCVLFLRIYILLIWILRFWIPTRKNDKRH